MYRHISAGLTVAGACGSPMLLGQSGLWSCNEEPQGNLSSQSPSWDLLGATQA